jgi:hypothetical protein
MPTMTQYSRALDEIFELRRGFAYEADGVRASMAMARFPKSEREASAGQVVRMRAIARGERAALASYGALGDQPLRSCLVEAGIRSLSMHSWEAERSLGFPADTSGPAPEGVYEKAVASVLALRRAAAYERRLISAPLGYLSFPKSRINVVEEQAGRLMLAAQGHAEVAYAGVHSSALRSAMTTAGANTVFTRAEFEATLE